METNNTSLTVDSSKSPTQNQSTLQSVKYKSRNTKIVVGAILFILLVCGSLYFFYIHKNNFTNSPTKQIINPSSSDRKIVEASNPKPSPSSTKLSSLLEKYKYYSVKNGNAYNKGEVINNSAPFESETLKISLLYPENLYFKAGMEPKAQYRSNPGLLIAMTNTPTSKYYPEDILTHKDYIDYSIDCRTDPNPDGICAEGIAPWLDISIHENPDIQDFNREEVEHIGKFKSISTQTVNLDGTYANKYKIMYPSSNKNYVITFTSKTNIAQNEDYIYAIWLLLNSFEPKK